MQKVNNLTILVTKEIFSKFNDEIDQPNVFNFNIFGCVEQNKPRRVKI
jgi:hypothetical protein